MIFKFGTFEFDDQSSELRKGGRVVAIEPQPAKALAQLLGRALVDPEGVVSREELRDAVWGKDTHVDFDRGLAYCISQVRSALGDSGENPRFVQTIPKRGFRGIDRPNSPARRLLLHTGNLVFFPSGVPTAKIAFLREGGKATQLTLADPNVMLTARRT